MMDGGGRCGMWACVKYGEDGDMGKGLVESCRADDWRMGREHVSHLDERYSCSLADASYVYWSRALEAGDSCPNSDILLYIRMRDYHRFQCKPGPLVNIVAGCSYRVEA